MFPWARDSNLITLYWLDPGTIWEWFQTINQTKINRGLYGRLAFTRISSKLPCYIMWKPKSLSSLYFPYFIIWFQLCRYYKTLIQTGHYKQVLVCSVDIARFSRYWFLNNHIHFKFIMVILLHVCVHKTQTNSILLSV